jgi:hypothetical protein
MPDVEPEPPSVPGRSYRAAWPAQDPEPPSVPGRQHGATWAGLGIGLGFALLQFLVARGDRWVGIGIGVLGLCAAGIAATLTVAAFLVDRLGSRARTQRGVEEFGKAMLALAIAGSLQIPGCVATYARGELRIHRAQAWCEELLPRLDAYREQQGHYPATLLELGIPNPPSDYTEVNGLYRSYQDGFGFDLMDGGWCSGWCMSSSTRTWQHYD